MSNVVLTRLDASLLHQHHRSGAWRDETIYERFRDHAQREASAVAVRTAIGTVSYGELLDIVDRFATHLRSSGLRPGDRVAVWLPSRAETVATFLACNREGLVACPSLHRDHTVADVAELIDRMAAKVVVYETGYGADGPHDRLADRLEGSEVSLLIEFDPHTGRETSPLAGLTPHLPSAPAADAPVRRDPDVVTYLAFTSGTTGAPKGVMHTDNTLLAPARAMARDWSLGPGDPVYSLSPLSHNLGFGAMVLALLTGAELILHDLPRGGSLARRLADTQAAFILGVPTHAIDLLAELEAGAVDGLPHLRGFRISGAAIPTRIAEALLERGIRAQSGYGMTEGGSHHYTRPDDPTELVVGTSGRPFDGHRCRVVDRDDPERELPPGEVGQITSEGPSVTVGYFDDQRQTEQAFNQQGWLLTGDLGWVDEQGYIRITGRKKDLIIRGGHNIYPASIEQRATQHPGVTHAAAIPVPHERLGEKVGLVIQPSVHGAPSPDELLAHLATSGVSRYDMPEHLAVLDRLPLTASGKVAKRELLAMLDAGELGLSDVRYVPGPNATAAP